MKVASFAEVKAKFSEYINETERGPVVVTRRGRPAAVIIHMVDPDDLERFILAHSRQFQAIVRTAREQIARGDVMTGEELLRALETGEKRKTETRQPRRKIAAKASPVRRTRRAV